MCQARGSRSLRETGRQTARRDEGVEVTRGRVSALSMKQCARSPAFPVCDVSTVTGR